METKIFEKDDLEDAARLIRSGELVVFPTETVYGLGADALNSSAVKKIFVAKNRPQDNPLIVHVCDIAQVEMLAHVCDDAKLLMDKFWPGPLTLILSKKDCVSFDVTAGLDTVAIRMPSNDVALKLIELARTPIAAPSANISGRPSATNFEHVFVDLNGRVSGIIKHEESLIGVESSVVDLTSKPYLLLRPGGVSLEDIQKVLPDVRLFRKEEISNKSPGMKYKHYSPRAKIFLFEDSAKDKISEFESDLKSKGFNVKVLHLSNSVECSHSLFDDFRRYDKRGVDYILINAISEKGIGLAIMNRVRKAAYKIIS